ncbi:hypothetical protein ELI49_24325 [Rhizobium ruizarguesonis]|uniref:hypothetical protein n=1 Tax=Rhizobium ruizarguesonis TaxID=2081791 RepID=UPI0010309F80|nr:hypothetical protein [Rhizobium ruizarguesonis]TAU12660.1 hypothetical protein ELI49_24325 [Rhizobium ruizarguesonis]
MNIVEMSWRQLGSSYGLTISWPVEIEPSEQAEIERFMPMASSPRATIDGCLRWIDPNSPLAMWEAVGQLYPVSTKTAGVPPSLLMIAADLQFA